MRCSILSLVLVGAVAGALVLAPAPAVATTSAAPDPAAASVAAAAGWSWPVDGTHRVLRPFIAPPDPWGAGHRGVDLAAGSDVLRAPADGVVRFAGIVVDRGVLSIDHGDGVVSSFEPVTATVVVGETVTRGEVVATIAPGHCDEACVHVGVRVDGAYLNPLRWLGGLPRAVLLPTRPLP